MRKDRLGRFKYVSKCWKGGGFLLRFTPYTTLNKLKDDTYQVQLKVKENVDVILSDSPSYLYKVVISVCLFVCMSNHNSEHRRVFLAWLTILI